MWVTGVPLPVPPPAASTHVSLLTMTTCYHLVGSIAPVVPAALAVPDTALDCAETLPAASNAATV